MQACKPLANGEVIDLFDCGLVSLRALFRIRLARCFSFGWCQEFEELSQIAFIIPQRVRADVSFVSEMIEKLGEQFIEHVAQNLVCDSWTTQTEVYATLRL